MTITIDYVPDYIAAPGTALTGKVAIVTGGASGIGDAVGRIFAANQAKVILVDTDEEARFDRIVRLASMVTGSPIALISLLTSTRQ